MTKKEYFNLVREINESVRRDVSPYAYDKCYSEPRKKTGYRTKLFNTDNEPLTSKIVNHINNKFGDMVVARPHMNYYYIEDEIGIIDVETVYDVVYTPKQIEIE